MTVREMKPSTKQEIQFYAAYAMALLGVVLITIALLVEPVGQIHPSVIAAFGEILTFSGACLGLDYHYKSRQQ